jgi:hypothetical protein
MDGADRCVRSTTTQTMPASAVDAFEESSAQLLVRSSVERTRRPDRIPVLAAAALDRAIRGRLSFESRHLIDDGALSRTRRVTWSANCTTSCARRRTRRGASG